MKMTMIEALEKIKELNDYEEILVMTNAGEPQLIENAIEDIQRNADDPDEMFDLRVTVDNIREYDENGYFDNNEPLYRVVRETDDYHCGMSDTEWRKLFHPEEMLHNFSIKGVESRKFVVRSGNNTSARINVHLDWMGKEVIVVRLE